MADLATVVDYAQGKIGDPYVWGASGPNSFDCSGLVRAAYAAAGVDVPHLASSIGKLGTAVPLSAAPIGSVVYIDEPGATDHVGILVDKLNGGHMIDAPNSGTRVRVDPLGSYTSIRDLGLPAMSSGGVATSPASFTAQNVDVGSLTDPAAWEATLLKVAGGVIAGVLIIVGLHSTVGGRS